MYVCQPAHADLNRRLGIEPTDTVLDADKCFRLILQGKRKAGVCHHV